MDINDCKGCNLYKACYVFKDNSKCPCSVCLIKMICKQDCAEFTKFRELRKG